MSTEQATGETHVTVRNIGGIDETAVTLEPGVTVLTGRNATNRTSFLQAIMAALGSEDVSMKADADEARVELALDGETYTRTLERRNGHVRLSGTPYLDDPTLADLFAFLLESNEARRAVTTDADLRDIIMRPIDTGEIQSEIDRLVDQRREITRELDELDDLKARLPALEEKRTGLKADIEETEGELRDVEARIESTDADVEQSREERVELEEKLEELRDKRASLETVRYDLETERNSLESLRSERAERADEYDDLSETPAGELEDLESRIDRLRDRKQRLETEVTDVRSIIQFNEGMLEEGTGDVVDVLSDDREGGEITDGLVPGKTVTCWTCGSDVDAEQIEETVDTLRDLNQRAVGEIGDIDDELAELKERRDELEAEQRRREQLERERRELDAKIERTEERAAELAERRDELRDEMEGIERQIAALEDDTYEDVLDLHKEANQLEYDLGSLENDLERVEENIATIEERLDEESELRARREELGDEIESLRTRIARIEREAITEFNDHMDTVLDLLDYENLERIWIERTETRVRDGREKVSKTAFELHVVRRTDGGTSYEDTVGHLSESEREVTGFVFALAGFLAHEVYETVPFMLLDSMEAIDANRIATLLEYLEGYTRYLVVALLPEDANPVPDDHHYVESI